MLANVTYSFEAFLANINERKPWNYTCCKYLWAKQYLDIVEI